MEGIETIDLSFLYSGNEKPSLDDVSITIKKGIKTAILGANGAGKSTLFYHLNGVFKPSLGTVKFDGEPVSYRKKKLRQLRSKVSVVLQNPDDQIFGQTVEEDVAYGPRNLGLSEREVADRVNKALITLGLRDLRGRNTLHLSYGQRKRLALAGALAMEPEVLIMDEPTAGLDPQMALELMELAEQLHHEGITIVISTHDIDLAYGWADEVHVLRRGSAVFSGDPSEFFSDSENVHLSGLLQPSMFLLNRGISGMRGIPEAPFPCTESQLIAKTGSCGRGRFRIVPISNRFDREIMEHSMTGLDSTASKGIYGKHVRRLLPQSMLPIDYVFDGFESCMSDCLIGRDTVLFCDDNCIDLIERKIGMLEAFGSAVAYDISDAMIPATAFMHESD